MEKQSKISNRVKFFLVILLSIFISINLILVIGGSVAKAENPFQKGLDSTAEGTGHKGAVPLAEKKLQEIIAPILGAAFIGISFLCFIVYGGYIWLTAKGDAQQVEKAQTVIKNAILGLVMILSAYAITWFIFTKLVITWTPVY